MNMMNLAPSLLFAAFILVQLVSCGYEVVCKTEYSYVLKEFNSAAEHFQENLFEVKHCLDSSFQSRSRCFDEKNISPTYSSHLLSLNDAQDQDYIYNSPLTNESINELHRKVCSELNKYAEREKYAKDIELREYNILVGQETIQEVLNNLKIGIKVETDKSEVLKFINQYTMLMRAYFGEIKACLGTGNEENYFKCIINTVDARLFTDLKLLPNFVNDRGGLTIIDDTDLKILLNKCLARKTIPSDKFKKDLIFKKYDSDSDYVMIEKHKLECAKSKLSWVKLIGGIFGAIVAVISIAFYFTKKPVNINDEEKIDYDDLK